MYWKKSIFKKILLTSLTFWMILACHFAIAQESKAKLGGDFTLQSPQGPVSLHDFQGKVVLLFFGYTSCPSMCPISLLTMERTFSQIPAEILKKIQALFISLDPEHDTLEKLNQYTEYFHPNILGVTDIPERIARVAQQYGVVYSKKTLNNSALKYVINHTADIFLVDPQGNLQESMAHNSPPQRLRDSILRLLPQ